MTVQISLFDQAQPAEAICYGADSGKVLQFHRTEKTEAPSKGSTDLRHSRNSKKEDQLRSKLP